MKKWTDKHHRMPSRYSDDKDEKDLGTRTEKYKDAYRKNKSKKEEYDKLESLPYWSVYKKLQK